MENASKALIIAGAILLSILLISLGILIFNQANDVVSGSGMSQAELSSFNAKFTQYEGTKRGSVVRSLVQEAIANNNSENASEETIVDVKLGDNSLLDSDKTSPDQSQMKNIKNTATYTLECEYTKGRVSAVKVTSGSGT